MTGDAYDDVGRMEQAEKLLAEAAKQKNVLFDKQIVDWAEQARTFARQSHLGTSAINKATVVKLRAERLIADHVDAGQAAGKIATGRPPKKYSDSEDFSTLEDLGLVARQVAEARVIRNTYSDEELIALAYDATDNDRILSRDKIVRNAAWQVRTEDQGRYADTANLGHADILYVDPPWQYGYSLTDNRTIENHYPTMNLDDLGALEMPTGPDAVMFCWATSPKLDDALQLLRAWRFTYRTCMVWVKDRIGMGYYARQRHELLLIAVRGTPAVPAPADRPDSVITGDRLNHSAKPEAAYDLIDRMYPNATKRELFARHRRPGWLEPWGLDVPA